MSSTLPHIKWVWGPDGRRREVWVFPSGEPGEIAEDAGDDQHPVQFTAVPMPPVKTSSKLDEFALDVLLAQCGETKPGSKP